MDRVKVLVKGGADGDSYGFFKNLRGGGWHGKDVEVIFWMGRHWVLVTLAGFMVGWGVAGVLRWMWRMAGKRCQARRIEEKRGRDGLLVEEGRYGAMKHDT